MASAAGWLAKYKELRAKRANVCPWHGNMAKVLSGTATSNAAKLELSATEMAIEEIEDSIDDVSMLSTKSTMTKNTKAETIKIIEEPLKNSSTPESGSTWITKGIRIELEEIKTEPFDNSMPAFKEVVNAHNENCKLQIFLFIFTTKQL